MGGQPTETRDWIEGARRDDEVAAASLVATGFLSVLGWFALTERIGGEEDLTRMEIGLGKEPVAHGLPRVVGAPTRARRDGSE